MIETTLALSVAIGIVIASAIIGGFCYTVVGIQDRLRAKKWKKEEENKKKPMAVKRFQYLAGIIDSYEEDDGTLRCRFNRIRPARYSRSYGDYNLKFNLQNMIY